MSSEGQRIVQELDTSDEDANPGRHRAPASAVRSAWVRAGIAALAVLLTVGLGAATADVLGLTEVDPAILQSAPPRVVPSEAEPRAGRTVDLGTRPAPPSPQPEVVPAAPVAEPPTAAVARPDQLPAPEPLPVISTEHPCQAGVTARGHGTDCLPSSGKGPKRRRG